MDYYTFYILLWRPVSIIRTWTLIVFVFRSTESLGGTICKHTFVQAVGNFSSPDFPNNYPNDIENHCIVHIKGWPGSEIVIRFVVFDMEEAFDYVEVTRLTVLCWYSCTLGKHRIGYFIPTWSECGNTCQTFYRFTPPQNWRYIIHYKENISWISRETEGRAVFCSIKQRRGVADIV